MLYSLTENDEIALFMTRDEFNRLTHSVSFAALDYHICSALQEIDADIERRKAGIHE